MTSRLQWARMQWVWSLTTTVVALIAFQSSAYAQFGFNRGAVGGVMIDAQGNLRVMTAKDRSAVAKELQRIVDGADAGLGEAAPLRRISLKRLEAACRDFIAANPGENLPDELRYLGGLLHIQYILVDPSQNDIVLAGPAEGWKVDADGNVVGITTGLPVMQLEDLLVALRTVDQAVRDRITCSIDPTEAGHRRLAALLDQQKRRRGKVDPRRMSAAVKQAFGPQTVRVTGVPATSHFAHVLVAADYRMKRIAMGLEMAPISGLPNYVALLQKNPSSIANTQPRWWLAPDFAAITRSEDGLAFSLPKTSVQLLTEEEYLGDDGQFKQTGRKSKAAESFATAVSQRYDELAKADPVFGELRNLMELSVVAALIERQELFTKAGLSLPLLTGVDKRLPTAIWQAPKTVPAECSIVRIRRGWLVTASGGVEIDAWELAKVTQVSSDMGQTRSQYLMPANSDWWAN